MNPKRIIALTTAATAAFLSLTACSGEEEIQTPGTTPTSTSAEPSESPTEESIKDKIRDQYEEVKEEDIPDAETFTKEEYIELRAKNWSENSLELQEKLQVDLNDPMEVERTKRFKHGGTDLATCEANVYFSEEESFDMNLVALYAADPNAAAKGDLPPDFYNKSEEIYEECMVEVSTNSASGYYDNP